MPTLSVFLLLAAGVFHVLRDLMTKQSRVKLVFVWWMSFFSMVMLSPICVYLLFQTRPPLEAVAFALAMGLVHASYWTFYSKAYEQGEISHVYPIIHSAPAFVLLFGVLFLGEHPDWLSVLGILSVSIGFYTISMKRFSWKSILDPVVAVKTERHTRFAVLALILVISYSLCDKVAVGKLHPLVYAFIMSASALCIFSVFIRRELKASWLTPIRHDFRKVLWAALFASINYPLTLFALQLTQASYVSGFRQISVVMAVFVGVFWLKEHYPRQRLISSVLIFLGAILIAA